ncbi:hypothetical protein [Fontivita pretiosa]|uniref:hypothetical protein n=1 Tax=Fontivita pretiosa TaxID=2989684 RepID=UPI003D17145B
MPADFDMCVKKGGQVKTIKLNDTQYMHVCYLDGKSYNGEVKTKKSEGHLLTPSKCRYFAKNAVFSMSKTPSKTDKSTILGVGTRRLRAPSFLPSEAIS